MKIDLTPLVQAFIALLAVIITTKVIPYIKSKTNAAQFEMLNAVATVAVRAAEQIYEYGDNKAKVTYAIDYVNRLMHINGYELDQRAVRAAIEKAVYELDNYLNGLGYTDEIPDLEDWDLETIKDFCEMNGIEVPEGCETKDQYIAAIVDGGKEAPAED